MKYIVNKKKYSIIILLFFSICTANISAEIIKQENVLPFVPLIMGMGNGYVAQAQGLYSLWTNPAGLATHFTQHDGNNMEVTAFAASLRTQPLPEELEKISNGMQNVVDSGGDSGLGSVTDQLSKTGMRVEQSIYGGFLYQSKGIGNFGIALTNTISISGKSYGSLFATDFYGIDQMELMSGYAYGFDLGTLDIRVGAALRPIFRTYNFLQSGNALSSIAGSGDFSVMLDESDGYHGWGIGADIGGQLEWSGFILGIAVRDIYTQMFYSKANVVAYFTEGQLNNTPSDTFVIPLSFNVGIAYKITPPHLKYIFNATVYAQLTDPLDNTNTNKLRSQDFMKHVHAGINFGILPPFFSIQLGVNQGYPTLGIAADLWFFDISFVIFTAEEGYRIRETPSPGMGLEIAFRW